MKKVSLLLVTSIIIAGLGGVIINNQASPTKVKLKTTVETSGFWKGFKITEQGTYIIENYDQLYSHLKNLKFFQKQEAESKQLIFSLEENNKLLNEKKKIVFQDYPKQAILSPFHLTYDSYDYVTAIMFVPDTTLDKTENVNLGLTKVQYQAYQNDLLKYQKRTSEENLIKPNQVEIMHITCKLKEIPSEIQTITQDYPLIIDSDFLPIITDKDNNITVGYRWSAQTGNSEYLYILTKEGGCISYDGYVDSKGRFEKHKNSITIDQVDRIMYLFFQPNTQKGTFAYRAKIVIFSIEE